MQCRFRPRNEQESEQQAGILNLNRHYAFRTGRRQRDVSATGVTTRDYLRGVRFFSGGASHQQRGDFADFSAPCGSSTQSITLISNPSTKWPGPPGRCGFATDARSQAVELENLIFEKAPIAMVTVNRPKALNALNVRVVEELAQILRDTRHDPAIRAVIITRAAFVAEHDLPQCPDVCRPGTRVHPPGPSRARRWRNCRSRLSRRPTASRWAGVELAMACEVIVATNEGSVSRRSIWR